MKRRVVYSLYPLGFANYLVNVFVHYEPVMAEWIDGSEYDVDPVLKALAERDWPKRSIDEIRRCICKNVAGSAYTYSSQAIVYFKADPTFTRDWHQTAGHEFGHLLEMIMHDHGTTEVGADLLGAFLEPWLQPRLFKVVYSNGQAWLADPEIREAWHMDPVVPKTTDEPYYQPRER